jgi:hypothetical protein
MRAFLRRHLVAVSVVAVLAVGAAVFVAVWFQPQKLVIYDTVQEALPTASASPTVLVNARFRPRSHEASGTVRVLQQPDGDRILRLEDLDVENGPDLYVYLTEAGPDAPSGDYGRRFLSLGKLKGNKGNQTYAIPAGADLSRYASVAIWCKRFSTVFATASLT